jgi:hypothetical protein
MTPLTPRAALVEDALKTIVRVATEDGRDCLNADEIARVNRLLDVLSPEEIHTLLTNQALGS